MNINEIISEADMLVPNEVPIGDKVIWLNALNQDFFNVVKIPKIAKFDCVTGQGDYVLPADVRQKNIDLMMIGMFPYKSLDRDDVTPAQNAYSFDDVTKTLSLFPAPYSNLKGFLRYRRIATTLFTSTALTVPPDAPEEYHWTFIPALASMLASSQDDMTKASNYENQYKAAWNVAAQNYQAGAS
ncbi:phage adaptor protein [Paenibacillus hubeiensis]|uniref:phage adaptor protein n=1 Tax=Paenibacillus hubeiensis TaxID=3077330 RepID=UPI0031BB5473